MATSVRAWGEVRKAKMNENNLPENIYFDKKGKFAVNPDDANSALPMGDYKGFALGLFIEILAGSFMGRLMGSHQMKGDYRMLTRGGFIIVLNPRMSTSISEFKKSNSRLVKEIKGSKKLKGVKEIVIPGERGAKNKSKNEANGYLELDKELWEELRSYVEV